ncbi:phosphoribosylformylglycinamidine synthase subunit PurS [Sodalinema gerasimenkoae]|uniref:phosphoribosylformylglycinamidine synthase subunit PurS n=1 Tax=Sodalinema gerasimenkoae TaxID=2862348 RepID=UPI00135A1635|nr:phosphoribosylformylglycinamidine synthase subunit PurS [Sodalinema gerasimenkoae]
MSQTYQAQIYVTLRPSVLDPAGTAVQSGLQQLGFTGVAGVRIGKYVELTVTAADEADATQQVDQMCDRLLANPTIENYRFEVQVLTEGVAA